MKIAGDLSRAWVSLKIVHHALRNPVQLPVKVQLTINLRTAKALGLNVPSSFLLRADEVIEKEVPCCDCSRPLLARNGPQAMSAIWSLTAMRSTMLSLIGERDSLGGSERLLDVEEQLKAAYHVASKKPLKD